MKYFILCIIGIFIISPIFSQVEPEPERPENTLIPVRSNRIYGKIIDLKTDKTIEAASVQLYYGNSDSLKDGMLSKANGEFNFRNLEPTDSFRLVISALGYEDFERFVEINYDPLFSKDLGNILLTTGITQLSGVTVTSSRPALEMGIDRKIFNVDKSLVSTGGTAIDIMKNIPSVSVDIEGNVELRNSSPQIFVDGRPTILTLDQIPADQIDRIELITNPSAKFDASSSGGIINVVLKKNKRVGINGLLTLSGGTPSIWSSNLNLNLRQNKFNFFVSGGLNQSGGNAKGRALRQNKQNGTITDYFNQYTQNERDRRFKSIRFGLDYFMDNRNSFNITQNYFKGNFGNDETQDQRYLDANKVLQYYGDRSSTSASVHNRQSTRLNFKHDYPQEGKELTADINYNTGNNNSNSDINNFFYYPDGSQYQQPSNIWNTSSSSEDEWTFQVDYSNPINENKKIETGVRSYMNDFTSVYDAFARNNGLDIKLPLSNKYSYKQYINAAYFTYSYKKDLFSYQLGLRAEHSKFNGELPDSAYKFGYEYPARLKNIWDALFPSFFITKKFGEDDEAQFNYTRRIRRPRFWQLNPFIDINDPNNLQQGNPALQPEFINSFEVNYSKNYNKGNILSVLYFRSNPNDITQYSDTITTAQYQQLNNAAISPNAILNTYINASTTNRYGFELTLQHKAGKNFEITPTFNLQYRTVKANIDKLDLSNKGFNWEGKLITNYKIENPKRPLINNLSFQLIADYESPRVIPQGRRLEEFDVDVALKKEFLKNKKATITFAVNDLFNTRRWGTIYDTDRFYQDSYRRWRVRSFRLSFTYKFGDAKFSLLQRNNNNDDD